MTQNRFTLFPRALFYEHPRCIMVVCIQAIATM